MRQHDGRLVRYFLFFSCLLLFALLNGSSFFPRIYSYRPQVNINIVQTRPILQEKPSYLIRTHIQVSFGDVIKRQVTVTSKKEFVYYFRVGGLFIFRGTFVKRPRKAAYSLKHRGNIDALCKELPESLIYGKLQSRGELQMFAAKQFVSGTVYHFKQKIM